MNYEGQLYIKIGGKYLSIGDADKVIAEAIDEHEAKRWHPYPKEKPKKGGRYLVTCYYHTLNELSVKIDTYTKGFNYTQIIAFSELPEPYKEGDKP